MRWGTQKISQDIMGETPNQIILLMLDNLKKKAPGAHIIDWEVGFFAHVQKNLGVKSGSKRTNGSRLGNPSTEGTNSN